MLEKEELKFLEKEIKTTMSNIVNLLWEHFTRPSYGLDEPSEDDFSDWNKIWLRKRLRDLYVLIMTYLEAKGMNSLLVVFQAKFQDVVNDDESILKEAMHHAEAEFELRIIHDFQQYLNAFKAFDATQTREDEILKLCSILRETDHVLKKLKATVGHENDISKQMIWVLRLYYPTCRNGSEASFAQQFKTYKPDILIPELKVAIEYKHIKNARQNLDDYIDQISVDAKNYVEDYRFDRFIAVMYLEDTSIAPHDSIQEA